MKRAALYIIAIFVTLASGCSTTKSVLALDDNEKSSGPIRNPFITTYGPPVQGQAMVVRTRKGDRSVEVEVPTSQQNVTDLVVPVNPNGVGADRDPASEGSDSTDDLRRSKPTAADHEITSSFPHSSNEDEMARRGIEQDLGLAPSDPGTPDADSSYLAGIDHVKQLFRLARYEGALVEVEEMLKLYPTSPQLYEMRGTLLDRMGQRDLAIRSWQQALHFDPKNEALRKFLERKRKIASEPAK